MSPLEVKKYKEVLADLFKIIEILGLLNQQKITATETAKWLQIIDAYTNQYPKYAIVNYLYSNALRIDKDFEFFLKSLTRYIYYQGSTSTVKFEIYNIIKLTSAGRKIDSYFKDDISPDYFNYLGRLKKGFALLAFYLDQSNALPTYNIDKIVGSADAKSLPKDWEKIDLNDIVDSLGNFVVIDMPKKLVPFSRKAEYFGNSQIQEVRSLFENGSLTYEAFIKRDKELKSRLAKFFNRTDNE